MTGVVQADFVGEGAKTLFHLYHIVQELNYIHNLSRGDAFVLSFQQTGVVDLDKGRATNRRRYDIIEILEFLLEFLCQGDGLLLKSCICHRLTTTCLVERIFDIKPKMLQ